MPEEFETENTGTTNETDTTDTETTAPAETEVETPAEEPVVGTETEENTDSGEQNAPTDEPESLETIITRAFVNALDARSGGSVGPARNGNYFSLGIKKFENGFVVENHQSNSLGKFYTSLDEAVVVAESAIRDAFRVE